MKPEFAIAVTFLFALVGCLIMAFRALFKREAEKSEEASLPAIAQLTESPKCFCGELATEPMPVLERNRGTFDFLRRLYAAPPRYVRSVDRTKRPELCRIHAHVADAKMDEFIFQRVRGIFAKASAEVATEAASFEREALLKYLNDSLTDREKKALRQSQTSEASIVILRAGNDGTRS